MIKAAISRVVSHLTIVHVLRSTGCERDHVVMTGFAQWGYRSCYDFQLQKQSQFCRATFTEQNKRQQSWLPHLCVLFSSSLCSIWIHYGALLLFTFFQCLLSVGILIFFFSVHTNKLPTQTNTEELTFRVLIFLFPSSACANNAMFNWTLPSVCISSN